MFCRFSLDSSTGVLTSANSLATKRYQLNVRASDRGNLIGQFQKISVHHDGRLFGIPRARGVLWTGILKAWGGTYIWNSEGLKLLILWTLPVRKWSTTERRNTDDDRESAGYRRSIDRSGMCWRKPIKLGLHIKFMNFLTMNIRLIKYEQIFVRVCTVNMLSSVLVGWTAKTRTSPLLL